MTPETESEEVARLLGRPPAGRFAVVVRRQSGAAAVIENAVFLEDGRPMPTRYWLVDRKLCEEVSRLEAGGGVRRAAGEVPHDAVAVAHARYAAERDSLIPPEHTGPVPAGGVGGTRKGVKCLHAHLAWFLAGGDDPVGRWTAETLGVDAADFVKGAATGTGPIAAVDCGTNSTRLIVADREGTVLVREMRITRLGEGVDTTGQLLPEAIERTLAVLEEYRLTMDRHAVSRVRTVATSAVRDASNADDFLGLAGEVIGVVPQILTGEDEGRLSFLGATAQLPEGSVAPGPVLVVDIGGGSTELSIGDPSQRANTKVSSVSLDLGCVRVSERYFLHDPPTAEELAQARVDVEAAVRGARDALPPIQDGGLLIGLAGTVSTVTSLERSVPDYDRDLLHHTEVQYPAVERWLQILSGEDSVARLARPGMAAGREDVIVGGVLILAVVMDVFACGVCLYSEDDILDGMVADITREMR